MSSTTDTMPVAAAPAIPAEWKQRTFAAAFLGVCAIAMLGWLIGLTWAAVSLTAWLFF